MEEWKQKITYKDALEQKLIEFEKELRAEGLIDKLTSFQNSKNFPISVFRTYGLFISEFKDSKRNLELKGDKSFSRWTQFTTEIFSWMNFSEIYIFDQRTVESNRAEKHFWG